MEGDETFQDIENSLDANNLPNEVPGRVFKPYHQVQDLNVADGESIILEWKIALENKAAVPYAYDPRPNVKRKEF